MAFIEKGNGMRKWMLWAWVLVLVAGCASAPKKNIIVMIPDGTGMASVTVAREVRGKPLVLDGLMGGTVATRSASHVVTDSAAAGTAMSCGQRTRNGSVGVDIDRVPLLNFGEWAKQQGKAVGIVTTDVVTGATPSAFSAHAISRNEAEVLFEQQMTSGFDLYLAGGQKFLTPERRRELAEEGYTLVETREEMEKAQGQIFGLFAQDTMTAMVARRQGEAATEPTLSEMTTKALEVLEQDPDGFFLMVEGAQVDKGNHAHDLAWATYELLAFDEAVETVMNWAKERDDTVVVIAPDHETGGLTIFDEPSPGARAEALQQATKKGEVSAQKCYVHYSTTWHTGCDVFFASNDPELRIPRNDGFRETLTGEGATTLPELKGTTEVRDGKTYLVTEDGKTLQAHRDAIYIQATGKWYQR